MTRRISGSRPLTKLHRRRHRESAASAGYATLDTHDKMIGADEMPQTPHRLLPSTPNANRSEAMADSTAAGYEDHINRLLAEHCISVDWRDRTVARSWRRTRRVRLQRVRGASSYAIALHEIGHVVGPQAGRRLDKEAQAWRWAEQHAQEWTEGMARVAARCIQTYLQWCERRRGVWVPPQGHDSRRIADRNR